MPKTISSSTSLSISEPLIGEIAKQNLDVIADFALILTLLVLIAYTYFTHKLAKSTSKLTEEAFTLSASSTIKKSPYSPVCLDFIMKNHTKFSLNCWCNLNATVLGQPIFLDDILSGRSSVELQPFGGVSKLIDIQNILDTANRTFDQMHELLNSENFKELLSFSVEFSYKQIGSNLPPIKNPTYSYYYDFVNHDIIADF